MTEGNRNSVEEQRRRWEDWLHAQPELETSSLFMPQQLIAACDPRVGSNLPMEIAAQIGMYVQYHLDRGSRTELLVFTRTHFLMGILWACLDLDPAVEPGRQTLPAWNRNPEIRAEERLILVRACLRAFIPAALYTEPLSSLEPLPEVADLLRQACRIEGVFACAASGVVGLTILG